uniref:Vomeronasal type-1 receptor n=1 Tax=Xenopus tropicalis TaxID=8364 RepID=A0A803K059_XENTR
MIENKKEKEPLQIKLMDINLLSKAAFFLFLVIIGIPANSYIVLKFIFIKMVEKKFLPTNIILTALALMNLLIVFSRVILQYLNAIGVENLLDDTQCKLSVYTYRVSRSMSISTTTFLSCYQCILIAPSSGIWSYLKQKVTPNVLAITICLLVINIILDPSSGLYAQAKKNSTASPYTLYLVYCNMAFGTYNNYIANGSLFATRDFLLVGLMALASTYIVYILIKHKRSVKDIRSSSRAQGKSAEDKASRAVIMLVILYVLLFGFDNCMWIYTLTLTRVTNDMNDARIALACSYSALSPIVIIANNPKLQPRFKWLEQRKTLNENHKKVVDGNLKVASE